MWNSRKVPGLLLRIRRFTPLCLRGRIRECTRVLIGLRWDIRTRTIRFTPSGLAITPVRWRIVATVVLLVHQDIHAEVVEEEADTVAASITAIGKMGTMTTAIGRTQSPDQDPGAGADLAVAGLAAAVAEVARVAADVVVVEVAADLAAAAAEAGRVADGRAVEAPDPTQSRRKPSRCQNPPPSTWLQR